MKKILAIIGARPQFIKHAPVEIAAKGIFEMNTVHTGQHYDYKMSQIFFDELNISKPTYNLQVGSGNHGEQTAKIMLEIEPIMIKEKPDFALVYGDTNSTLAGALVAAKLHIPVIHIEAGLRSFNRTMPEEINRVVTDHISYGLFVPTKTAVEILKKEGISKNVFLMGDVMYDMIKICELRGILKESADKQQSYYFATIHRPYNTDDLSRMQKILDVLEKCACVVKFAVHPRTYKSIKTHFELSAFKNIHFCEPLSYFETIKTINNSKMVITDSGGVQKEAYMLRKKCITIRSETEWVETLQNGWNILVFDDFDQFLLAEKSPTGPYIDGLFGNGKAANEIVDILKSI